MLELLRRRKARTSLAAFTNAITVPGRPQSDAPFEWRFHPVETGLADHHLLLLDTLEELADPDNPLKRLMVFMPPGSAKSTYCSVVFPAWLLGKNPGDQIILGTYGDELSKRLGRKARQIVRSSEYTSIFDCTLSRDSSAANEWQLTNGSQLLSGGMLTGVTGNRAHGLIIDDPVKGRQQADSPTVRKSTLEAYEDDWKTRRIPGGWVLLIQTRWHEDDLAGSILPEDWDGESGDIECRDGQTWRVICIQAQCERTDDPLGREIGEFLWPDWFSPEHFEDFKKVSRTWRALYQGTPRAEDGDLFRRENVLYYDKAPKHLNIYMSGDFAVTEDQRNDFTEIATWGVAPDDSVYVLDWWYEQCQSDKWTDELVDRFKADKPIRFCAEAGQIRRAVEPWLRKEMRKNRAHCTLDWEPTTQNKEAAASSFAGLFNSRQVYWPRTEWAERVISQLMRFPAGRYDDAVDACSRFGQLIHKAWAAEKPKPKVKKPKPGDQKMTMQKMMPKDELSRHGL